MATIHRVCELTGLKPATIRAYLKESVRERAAGNRSPKLLPLPTRQSDGMNHWLEAEIVEWDKARRAQAKPGAIPKSEMRAVLTAARLNDLDTVIKIAQRNLQ